MNTITSKAAALAEVLQSKAVALPIYVRFQTASQMLTVPVVTLTVSDDELTVEYKEGQEIATRSFMRSDLTDIVAFCDANRKPVFLHDFAAEKASCEEIKREEERKELASEAQVRKSQYIYRSLEAVFEIARIEKSLRQYQPDRCEMRKVA